MGCLEIFLNEVNQLVKLLKQVLDRLQNDNYMVVIKGNKEPVEKHVRRFNATTVNYVVIVITI